MKEDIISLLNPILKAKDIKISKQQIDKMLEIPPSVDMGDYAFPCFSFSDKLKMSPHEIALEIRQEIGNHDSEIFDDIQVKGPYVNFFSNKSKEVQEFVYEVLKTRNKFGKSNFGKRKTIVLEFSSPNIAKKFGIGHLRSTIIGNSLANICEFQGFTTKRINYIGDWGAQFGQLIFGFKKFGKESELKKDPINYLQKIYVKVNKNKAYQIPSKKEFQKLEQGDRENLALWRRFREISLEEFKETYKDLGVNFDEIVGESDANKNVEKIIKELKDKKLAKRNQGALIVNLKKYDLGVAIIQKTDGTSTYCIRDIAELIRRYKKYNFKQIIYEVGQEQRLHFKQVFKILELMGYEWAVNCKHVDHGLYLGKDGKKLSTRKGKTVDIFDIKNMLISSSKNEIKKRFPELKAEEINQRAEKVAITSLIYGDLKNNRSKDMIFDTDSFVSMNGNTGSYIMYSYARASSMVDKSKTKEKFKFPKEMEFKELQLFKKMNEFPDIATKAYQDLNPSLIATYLYQLSKIFNEFYNSHPVIGDKKEAFRITLVEAFRQVMRNASNLLELNLLEKM